MVELMVIIVVVIIVIIIVVVVSGVGGGGGGGALPPLPLLPALPLCPALPGPLRYPPVGVHLVLPGWAEGAVLLSCPQCGVPVAPEFPSCPASLWVLPRVLPSLPGAVGDTCPAAATAGGGVATAPCPGWSAFSRSLVPWGWPGLGLGGCGSDLGSGDGGGCGGGCLWRLRCMAVIYAG